MQGEQDNNNWTVRIGETMNKLEAQQVQQQHQQEELLRGQTALAASLEQLTAGLHELHRATAATAAQANAAQGVAASAAAAVTAVVATAAAPPAAPASTAEVQTSALAPRAPPGPGAFEFATRFISTNIGKPPENVDELRNWLRQMNAYINDSHVFCPYATASLLQLWFGSAGLYLGNTLKVPSLEAVQAALQAIKDWAGVTVIEINARTAVTSAVQLPNESVARFAARFRELAAAAGEFYENEHLIHFFTRGVRSPFTAQHTLVQRFENLSDAIDYAVRTDNVHSGRFQATFDTTTPMHVDALLMHPPGLAMTPPGFAPVVNAVAPMAASAAVPAVVTPAPSAAGDLAAMLAAITPLVAALHGGNNNNNGNRNGRGGFRGGRNGGGRGGASTGGRRCWICGSDKHISFTCPKKNDNNN